MGTTLYLIRHGQTEGAEGAAGGRRYKGRLDVPLSAAGEQQAVEAGKFVAALAAIAGRGISALYSSDLSRALRSAELIGGCIGLRPMPLQTIRERDFGLWEGMTFEEIDIKYPGEFRAWAKDPLNHSPIGGESTLQVRDRAVPEVAGLVRRHEGESIAVVAHGGINRIVLAHYIGLPLEHIFRIEQDLACVNIIEFQDRYPLIKLLNGMAGGISAGPSLKG